MFAESLDTEGDVLVEGDAEFSGEEARQVRGEERRMEDEAAWGASMLGSLFLEGDAAKERSKAGLGAKGIEGGLDGEFGHRERTLIEGLF